jgi:hypothetical protein
MTKRVTNEQLMEKLKEIENKFDKKGRLARLDFFLQLV